MTKIIRKKEVTSQIANTTGQTLKSINETLDSFVDVIIQNLREGNTVRIQDFITFQTKNKEAYSIVRGLKGKSYEISKRKVISLSRGTKLRKLFES
jgi:nucleoid DNA-binding protein